MKKLLLAVGCFLLLAAAASGLWKTRAVDQQLPGQALKVGNQGGPVSTATMQKLAQESHLILSGQCLRTRSAWIDRRLVTVATVSVNETVKGEPSATVDVVLPGGVDLNRKFPVSMIYPGAPTIQPREEVFLFLRTSGEIANSYTVTRFAEGKFSIVNDDQGQPLVSRTPRRAALPAAARSGLSNLRATPLSEFKRQIETFIK
ncbi:MAG TPA: hypothetical protein VJ302_09885 [Blastocatellia bacterium]|nr:hypothetical protein [Blastocatellia bacterium]